MHTRFWIQSRLYSQVTFFPLQAVQLLICYGFWGRCFFMESSLGNLFLNLKKLCRDSLNRWGMYVLFMLFGKNCESYPGKSQSQLLPLLTRFSTSEHEHLLPACITECGLSICERSWQFVRQRKKNYIKYYSPLVVWKFLYVGTKQWVILECSWTRMWSWRCAWEWNMWVGRISGVFWLRLLSGVPLLLLDEWT